MSRRIFKCRMLLAFLAAGLAVSACHATFDVAGSILKVAYKDNAGNAREETFKIKKLTESALILEDDNGVGLEFAKK